MKYYAFIFKYDSDVFTFERWFTAQNLTDAEKCARKYAHTNKCVFIGLSCVG